MKLREDITIHDKNNYYMIFDGVKSGDLTVEEAINGIIDSLGKKGYDRAESCGVILKLTRSYENYEIYRLAMNKLNPMVKI
jgi:hypothetical protein